MLKKDLFPQFTKQQKSALCHSVKSYVKKNLEKSDLVDVFLEDELYYIKMGSSRLYFIEEYLEDSMFLRELRFYFNDCIKYYEYQKSLEPIKQAQKEFAKQQRKKAQEFKMSKEPPTKRQLFYYKSLCKKYGLDKMDTETLSKLELRDLIDGILNEYQRD